MLISIIINNYNYGRFLADAIESALAQRYRDVEVIVVDDGSNDDSREVIAAYGQRVGAVFKGHGGQASALNTGFSLSQGDIVIFLDADDILLNDTAQRVADAFQADPSLAKIMYRVEVIDGSGRPTGEVRPHPHLPIHNGDLYRHVLTFPFDMTWAATSGNAFAARVLKQICPIPEDKYPILADYYLSHLASLFGPVVFLEAVGAYYRIHGANNHESDRSFIDLGQIRRTLAYSAITCVYIKQFADRLRLEDSPTRNSDLLSVSLISQRLVSLKLDPAGHPMPGDTAWRLFRLGATAALRRFDVAWSMRLIYIGWFGAMALAPARVARWLATQFLLPSGRRSLTRRA